MKKIISFSGGKDSLATLLLVIEKFGKKNLEVIFCDTGWESNITYLHIKDIEEQTGLKFKVLSSEKYNGFYDLSIKKKRVASTKARFCTEELKVKPMIDYILSLEENIIIYQGIRAEESFSRSKMTSQCTYFKYYFEQKKLDKNGKPVFDTYRKKDVVEWCKKYNADIIRPIFDWTAKQVFDFIKSKGLKANPLYYEGFSRVGCFPCIMGRKQEIKLIAEKYPEVVQKIRDLERDLKRTFFPPQYIPDRFCSITDKKTGKKCASVDDVIKYVQDNPEQETLIEKRSCESIYNICE